MIFKLRQEGWKGDSGNRRCNGHEVRMFWKLREVIVVGACKSAGEEQAVSMA